MDGRTDNSTYRNDTKFIKYTHDAQKKDRKEVYKKVNRHELDGGVSDMFPIFYFKKKKTTFSTMSMSFLYLFICTNNVTVNLTIYFKSIYY